MKRDLRILLGVGVLAIFLGTASSAAAKESKAKEKADSPVEQAAPASGMDEATMKKWEEYSTPNENHKVLDAIVGSWDYNLKWWMDPSQPPEETTGTTESRWIMGGRFIEDSVQGQSMGKPFEGRGITGYNNHDKAYNSIWLDNMGTGMMIAAGSYDAGTKTLTQKGNFSCPIKGEMAFRWVTKITDADNHTFQCFMTDDKGQESLSMEIVYKRKK